MSDITVERKQTIHLIFKRLCTHTKLSEIQKEKYPLKKNSYWETNLQPLTDTECGQAPK